MTDEEFSIVNFLKGSPEAAFSRKEIARKAVRRSVYDENQHWADVALNALVARGEIHFDSGLYRLKKDTSS